MELKSRSPATLSGNILPLYLPLPSSSSPPHLFPSMTSSTSAEEYSLSLKILTALFYATSSTIIIFINKIILTTYQFHYFYFLGAIQFLITSLILLFLSYFRFIEIPPLSFNILKDIFPIFLLFFGNVMCGLGGTQSLNLPMFTVLRRFSILMSMIGEYFILSIIPSSHVIFSVFLMIFGAMIAAYYDFSYDFYGYVLVLFNDIFTALNGVYLKKATISKRCSKMGVLFYNSLFSFMSLALYFLWSQILLHDPFPSSSTSSPSPVTPPPNLLQEIYEYPGWRDPSFILLFLFTALMGSILNYSIFLCTTINSPLTTAVIGCLKNILVTYFSMIFMANGGDYQFNYLNFIGLNISILGSIYYTVVTLKPG
jgi:solute carrier family 35